MCKIIGRHPLDQVSQPVGHGPHCWAIGDFAVSHRAIRKIGCLVQKSLISVKFIGELIKIDDSDALNFFRRSGQKLLSQRWRPFRAIIGQTTLSIKRRPFFRGGGRKAMVQQRLSTGQWAMQTFKKHKMGHGFEKVENHCIWHCSVKHLESEVIRYRVKLQMLGLE